MRRLSTLRPNRNLFKPLRVTPLPRRRPRARPPIPETSEKAEFTCFATWRQQARGARREEIARMSSRGCPIVYCLRSVREGTRSTECEYL